MHAELFRMNSRAELRTLLHELMEREALRWITITVRNFSAYNARVRMGTLLLHSPAYLCNTYRSGSMVTGVVQRRLREIRKEERVRKDHLVRQYHLHDQRRGYPNEGVDKYSEFAYQCPPEIFARIGTYL